MRRIAVPVSAAVRAGIELRRARPEDAESIRPLWTAAFNLPPRWADSFAERYRPERVVVAAVGGRVVATAQGFAVNQWFGGRPVPAVGIASVATDPLVRGTGLGPRVMARLLEETREGGGAVASLFPSTVPFYRRLGFEYGGTWSEHHLPLRDIPLEGGAPVDVAATPADDFPRVRESFRRLAEVENGMVEGVEEDWWRMRVMGRHSAEEPGGTVATVEDVPEGYACYRQERFADRWGFRLACSHLVAHTPRAAGAILGYFRRFKGIGEALVWTGPPADPLGLLVAEQAIDTARRFTFMTRILDVRGALEGRGYPEHVDGEAVLSVADELFPANSGSFRLEAGGGKLRVTRLDEHPGERALGIGALSTIFTGYATPFAAARAGLAPPDHPALGLLARLFAGPAPWTPDFF